MLLFLLFWLADPQQASSLLQRGLLAMQKGQTAEAHNLLEQAAKADDRNAYVWSSLAEVLRRLHDAPKSLAAAEKAEKLGDSDPLVCHALAIYYSETGKPERAAPLEQKFAISSRADPEALSRTAGLFLAAGAPDKAVAIAQQAVERYPSALSESVLGRALVAEGREPEAVPHLQAAWQSAKADKDLTFAYVNALLHVQAFSQAVDVMNEVLKGSKPDAQSELLLGVALYGQRRFEDAITTFFKVIQIDPEVEQPYLFLGRLLEQAGPHIAEIIKADTAWAAVNPDNAKAQLELAKALLQHDHSSLRAQELLRKSIALNDHDWESHYQLALLLEAKRDFSAAGEELNKSIALDGTQPMPHYHLARVYDRLGKSSEAEAERAIHTRLSNIPAKDRR